MINNLQGPLSLPWIEIGNFTYWGAHVFFKTFVAGEKILIGKYCSISDQVCIMTGGMRRMDTAALYPLHLPSAYKGTDHLVIGHDVWIGYGASIIGGVQVGNGAVIAAGAVVFNDVPAFAVVAGNPAQVVKYRFSEATADKLDSIAWWDWPEHEVVARREWFYKPIDEFIKKFSSDE